MVTPDEFSKKVNISWGAIVVLILVTWHVAKFYADKQHESTDQEYITKQIERLESALKKHESESRNAHKSLKDELRTDDTSSEARMINYSDMEIGGLRADMEKEDAELLERIKKLEDAR